MKLLKNSQGLALFTVIFASAVFLLFVTAGLLLSQMELKKANNFKLSAQAVEMADMALQHGVAVMPWVWDFNSQLNCSKSPCNLIPTTTSTSISGFNYTVTVKNDPADPSPTTDTNGTVVLIADVNGPAGTKNTVEAYVRRSPARFKPPAAVYINAASSSPALDSSNPGMGYYYFDIDNSLQIIGNDTNPANLMNKNDDTRGAESSIWGMATTSDAVKNALANEYKAVGYLHDVLGTGNEPSIAAVGDVLDVDKIADKFLSQAGTIKFFNGLVTDDQSCPSSSPCQLGTRSSPQITYIKDTLDTDITALRGSVVGYGVLVLEGRATVGGNFRFYGLVAHKRSGSNDYISFEDNTWVYGGIVLGSYNENDGQGKKARFGFKDYVRIFYSSEALGMVDATWGSLLPKPARIFAWLDK